MLVVASFDDERRSVTADFPGMVAVVSRSGALLLFDEADPDGPPLGGFAPDMWTTFKVVDDG